MSESLVDHLFEGDLLENRGQSSNILAMGDQLIMESLTSMELGELKDSEFGRYDEVSLPPHDFSSLALSPTPKWDGTPRALDIHQGVEEPDEGEYKKVMEEVLKKNQAKTTRKTKLKKRTIVEEEVQPENVLDPEGVEVDNDIDDDVTLGVML
ncbi:hypothetical protein HAX54_005695 [Datura stramonium]|uniref:Uncharacterized protein n=1 Tax=Datura stramonium TaxID=4076 RepID=A0ABS8TAM2_DATST|nr:hypothetical protein [Datura stramonium]